MTELTRRTILGSIAGAATLSAGCSESSSSGEFTQTTVEDQQLIVEFSESLDAETISVIDPAGESFAEKSIPAGVTRVTFDIEIPYSPGEYRIVAADGDTVLAETAQEIQPEVEIVDVGVGANRMEEMPEERGHARETEALVRVRNSGTGPERISQMQFKGDLPNPSDLTQDRIGIYNSEKPGEASDPILLTSNEEETFFSSTLPFSFEGEGVDCSSNTQTGEFLVELRGEVVDRYSKSYSIEYTSSDSYDNCEILLEGDS